MPMPAFFVLDSVTHLKPEHRGGAVYCASHGGLYAAYCAAVSGVGAAILNDAGIGRQRAGVAGLDLLDGLGVPAATISHMSARIGDGADGISRGVISVANCCARRLGIAVGMACGGALRMLSNAPLAPSPQPEVQHESRFEISPGTASMTRVIGLDSVSLVAPEDAGQVIVTASHGGLLGNRPESAVKVDVRAAVFNDAGGGAAGAGFSRLPALDARGIAGATVSCFSARIGDARSTYEDGYISQLNMIAAERGGDIGMSCREFVELMAR
jgi:hypothetical protein